MNTQQIIHSALMANDDNEFFLVSDNTGLVVNAYQSDCLLDTIAEDARRYDRDVRLFRRQADKLVTMDKV